MSVEPSRPGHLGVRFAALYLMVISLLDLLLMLAVVYLHAWLPETVSPAVLAPMTYVLAVSTLLSVVMGFLYSLLRYPEHRTTILVLALIVVSLLGAHLYTIGTPDTANCYDTSKQVDGCVMDEVYYVPAAQSLLAGEHCAPYADNCNLEHPFLSKAMIAAGIAIFGNGVFGWRIFEVLLGTFSIPLLFGICWALTRNSTLSLYAAFLLAFETLFFVHSSIAVIDIHAIFFGLLAILFYVAKLRWWKLGPTVLAGIAMGLAALSKETSIFLFGVLVAYILLIEGGSLRSRLHTSATLLVVVFVVFAVGLQAYDSLYGVGQASTFIGQVRFILSYGASLTGNGWTDTVLNTPITPLNWVTYYTPIGYLITRVTVTSPSGSVTYVSAGYYGVTTQFEVWLVYAWALYVGYLWLKTRHPSTTFYISAQDLRDLRLGRFALVWFLVVFLGYLALYAYGRVTYPYYFIQAVPALAVGSAYFLSRSWFPRGIAYVVLGGVLLWFFVFYPDKSFLPTNIRAMIGH